MKNIWLILALLLSGCRDDVKVFGIEIGGEVDGLRDAGLIKSQDLVPSKQHFLIINLYKAPNNEMGDSATYSVNSLDGKIIGVSSNIRDEDGAYYLSMVSYAKSKLGNPIASNEKIVDESAVRATPYGCIVEHNCPPGKYTIFRKNNVSAVVSSGDGKSVITFDNDELKKAQLP